MTEREQQILSWIQENPMISQKELADRAGITRSSVAVHISNLMKKGVIAGKGYIIRRDKDIVVVGGANMDICGTPGNHLIPADSNPGRVKMSMGGVGRNIAHNLRLLDQSVRLITAFGDDANAVWLQNGCKNAGIDIGGCLMVPGASTSCYLFITDERGEMQLAISDMEVYEHMTPEWIAGKLDIINHSALCILDTNIPQETIEFLAEYVTVPLFADPVSTTKMHKLEHVLDRIHTFKPNRLEAGLLTGIHITDESSLRAAADRLLGTGMKRVFISMGAEGVYCAEEGCQMQIPAIRSDVRNTTGSGDCFMAGLAYAYLQGLRLRETAQLALAAGAVCAEGENTINEALSLDTLYEKAGIPFGDTGEFTEKG